jgi:hypothetical protein
MIDERRPLPESVGALVQIAVRAYLRRFRLYFGTAVAGLLCEAVIAYFEPKSDGFFFAGSIVVNSLLAALVTIGVVSDTRGSDRLGDGVVANRAFERWGVVAAVTTLVDFVEVETGSSVFGPPDATAYWLLSLPIVVLWGSLGFASVIAALDDRASVGITILASLGRSFSLALARPNVGRLVALALVAVLPTFVEAVLLDQLQLRKIAGSQFIANVPIDALVAGPLQAVFTIFYLDFVRRSEAQRS